MKTNGSRYDRRRRGHLLRRLVAGGPARVERRHRRARYAIPADAADDVARLPR